MGMLEIRRMQIYKPRAGAGARLHIQARARVPRAFGAIKLESNASHCTAATIKPRQTESIGAKHCPDLLRRSHIALMIALIVRAIRLSWVLLRRSECYATHPCPSCIEEADMMRHNHPSLEVLIVQPQLSSDRVCPLVHSHVIYESNVKFAHCRAESFPQKAPFTRT